VDPETARWVEQRIQDAVELMHEIDHVVATVEPDDRERELRKLGVRFNYLDMATVCGKKELQWPTHFLRMNWFKILKTLLLPPRPTVEYPGGSSGS